MSIIAKNEILERLNKQGDDSIIVTPILDKKRQINQIGIDCRLGNQFLILKTQNVDAYDLNNEKYEKKFKFYKEIVIPFGMPFVLHPHAIVLGCTFEYISLPNNVIASIEGRSSWARLGLIIATAAYIDPGYKGCVTLEISNISSIPINLYPGLRIAQLIFSEASSNTIYENKKYNIPIGPEISKINKDVDNDVFKSINRKCAF